ncbi:glycerol-3-phosphate 1-O-acyltransferase PlsY [Phytoplasma sp.]|uniref:glycerol-3-phosphate 1-O-acyltransferase PlsY n=1 Tax=Phytoplasma sp. TaxID=2155 RepID=UPI002B40B5BE|nr:glycerol-3-phosphate 1-O-acyltransferase PlsY [Phytoplasma sp.]
MINIITYFLFYLFGSIPVGLIVSKLFQNKDLRLLGSKNIGSTNAVRVLGFKYGLIIFILDFCKGFCLLAIKDKETFFISGLLVIIGNMFSVFNRFKGGKAIATSVGFITVINPYIGISGIIFFVIFVRISGYASLSSILATSIINIFLWIWYYIDEGPKTIKVSQLLIVLIITIMIFIKHTNNIKNLIKRKENKFYFNKKK